MYRAVPFCVCALMIVASPAARAVEVGDKVLAYWAPAKAYFIGTAVKKETDGYRVVFADGDQGVIPAEKIRKYDLKVGSAVTARYTDGKFYPGKIAKVVGQAFYIHFDDGDKGWTAESGIVVR